MKNLNSIKQSTMEVDNEDNICSANATSHLPEPDEEAFNALVLQNIEDIGISLARTPLTEDCDDFPSIEGSHGLPLYSFPRDSPPPRKHLNILEDNGDDTPNTSSVRIRVWKTEEESPTVDMETQFHFDSIESIWKPADGFVPTVDYLQVPPHHRATFRKTYNDESLLKECEHEAGAFPRVKSLTPSKEEDDEIAVSTLPLIQKQIEQSHIQTATCDIHFPVDQKKRPSFSNLDIPCYQRRPSGLALDDNFHYSFGMMYGRYTRDLGDFVKEEAKKLKEKVVNNPEAPNDFRQYRGRAHNRFFSLVRTFWKFTFARVGEDWVFLAVLGILMAFISFLMDFGIEICNKARIWLYRDLASSNRFLQYMSWVTLPVCLIIFSAGFVHLTAPQAVGSGIPEMKTILRGVVLKEYLTFKTLIAKIIGLTATLGSGLPLGKEGPFVHIASIVATLLSKAITSFKGIYENESRNSEMLAAACAVGVACSFAAPIGGVLFSIEVTSVYFAVRNYWRGFFAAVCGAMMFRLLAVWFKDEDTLTPLFVTRFQAVFPFDPQELFVYGLVGIACGFLGALFVWVHRQYVMFMRRNKKMKAFLQKSHFLYPVTATLLLLTIMFPPFLGQFIASHLTTHTQVVELFSNITWTKEDPSVHEFEIIENWRTPWTNIFVNLLIYIVFTFCGSVVASTLPVPSGIFIPVFKIGAALGRIVGEAMAVTFPTGLSYGGVKHQIIPGGYSLVGAAAFAGAVTHTISTSVIVFELTGQITHILPVMIAVLIANGIAQLLQPSVYDSIIKIKKLPYLPDILTSTSGAYNMYVEDFMVRDVKYIWYGIKYRELKTILVENKKIRSLPLVDSPESMILLGSIQRSELITSIDEHLGRDRRAQIINKWKQAADLSRRPARLKKKGALLTELESKDKNKDPKEKANHKQKQSFFGAALPAVGMTALAAAGIGPSNQAAKMDKSFANFDYFTMSSTPTFNEPERTLTKAKSASSEDIVRPSSLVENHKPQIVIHLGPFKDDEPEVVPPKFENTLATLQPVEGSFTETRRPSRFEVTKVETPSRHESSVTLQVDPVEIPTSSTLPRRQQEFTRLPRKSILKKTHSFILPPSTGQPIIATKFTPYATVHAGDSKFRQTIEAVIRKRSLSKLESKSTPKLTGADSVSSFRSQITPELLLEKTIEQQKQWEEEELDKKVDFSICHIDPAPFQLVERTSLLKVHSLFSMLGLNHAYVTAIGRLIGVVALKELRRAIEEANQGEFQKQAGADVGPSAGRGSPRSSKTNMSSND